MRDDRYLLDNARVWADEFLDRFEVEVEHLAVDWNNRFTRTIATIELDDELHAHLKLGSLYRRILPSQRVEVIGHEVCHVAAWILFGDHIDDHGPHWKSLMRKLGYRPSAYMEVDEMYHMKGALNWPRNTRAQPSG